MGPVLRWARAPGRAVALIVLALAAAAYAADPYVLRELRDRGFDGMQRLWPLALEPITLVVQIDDESLRQLGQWPWPRTLTARLVDKIADGAPAALGIDAIFSEPDRLSPPEIPKYVPDLPAAVREALAGLQPSDATFARAIARAPTVLAAAPSDEPPPPRSGQMRPAPLVRVKGGSIGDFIVSHKSMTRTLPEISRAAAGEASVGSEIDRDGTVRSVSLVSLVEGKMFPAFAVEVLRAALGARPALVNVGPAGISGVEVGDYRIPTDAHGRAYLHFQHPPERSVSALDVLDGRFDRAQFKGRVVLLGVSALGLFDYKTTPLGPMFGTEIHAQLIDSILTQSLLIRHRTAWWIELALIVVPGLVVVGVLRYQRPFIAGVAVFAIVLLLAGAEFGLFRFAGWLIGTFYAAGLMLVLYGAMLGGNYIAARREGRRLEAELERQRAATARLEGELTAARSIQMGLLPLHFPAFPERREIDLYARIEPARNVGGDLFDFMLVDHNRLFFMIGDVSGKGIPAALFMATTKEVVRDAAVRHGAALDRVLAEASAKIGAASNNMADEGASLMFVTAFAGLLDLTSGDIVYASAGHDSPLVIKEGSTLRELQTEGGPPLGTVDDFPYPLSRDRLDAGAVLLLYTDGVTEAQDAGGTLYGAARLTELMTRAHPANAQEAIDLVFDSLRRFVGAADQFDDITLLAVRRLAVG